MACACKNKQRQTAKTSAAPPQRKSHPINNGGIASRRIEKRIIR